jgi:IS30 family transposase
MAANKKHYTVWTDEKIAMYRELRSSGMPIFEIAIKLGTNKSTVQGFSQRERHKIQPMRAPYATKKFWHETGDARLIQGLRDGTPQVQIARELGVNRQAITKRMHEINLLKDKEEENTEIEKYILPTLPELMKGRDWDAWAKS